MELASEDDGEKLPQPPGILFAGGLYEGISRLATRLRLIGDLPQDALILPDSKVYEGPLVDAVKRFQKRHGLTPNGYLTVDTVEQLNVPLPSRVEQLRLTLERYRWLRYSFTQPPVVVNLPEYRLRAFDRDGQVGLAMSVNVGDAYDFQTPVFESSIRYLVFRPYWNVPPRILRNEVIPDTAEDRSYIVDNDMEVTTLAGQVVASGPISDSVLQQLRAGKLTVGRNPGQKTLWGLSRSSFPTSITFTCTIRRRASTCFPRNIEHSVTVAFTCKNRRNLRPGCSRISRSGTWNAWNERCTRGGIISR
jgi:murein L,D-transpeptidase YcbB/YkuD